jgi:hypothetical protein
MFTADWWNVDRVAAAFAGLEAIAVVAAAIVAIWQLVHMAGARRDSTRAYVVMFFDFPADRRPFPDLVMKNLGATAAVNVEVTFTPPLRFSPRRQADGFAPRLFAQPVHAHYAGAVPLDLLKTEQERINGEIKVAAELAEAATIELSAAIANVGKATAFAMNCHKAYRGGSDATRRLMNQAIFNKIWVTEDGVVGWEYNEPFKLLLTLHDRPAPSPFSPALTSATDAAETAVGYCRTSRSPAHRVRAYFGAGSKERCLAERGGFEPPVPLRGQLISSESDSAALAPLPWLQAATGEDRRPTVEGNPLADRPRRHPKRLLPLLQAMVT